MKKKKYLEILQMWAACREKEKDIGECFLEINGGSGGMPADLPVYTDWLILPGKEGEAGFTKEVAGAWNSLLFHVFSRSARYRKSSEELWAQLEEVRSLVETQEMNNAEQAYSLGQREAPVQEYEVIVRERELRQIEEILEKEGSVFLYGIGGIGKSTVAKAYARFYREKYQTVVYAACEKDLKDLLADDERIPVKNLQYIPAGKRGEKGWYVRRKINIISHLADEKVLLIIDDLKQIRDPLIDRLLRLPCHLLITTRMNPEYIGKTGIEIKALDNSSDRLRLFEICRGKRLDPGEAAAALELMEKFDGHTLKIRLLAGDCAASGKKPSDLLKGELPVQKMIFDLPGLPQKERQLLMNAALLPKEGMSADVFLQMSANVSEKQLRKLYIKGLLQYDAQRKWVALHPVIRKEVINVLHPDWAGCRNYIRNYANNIEEFWNMTIPDKMKHQKYILAILDTLPAVSGEAMEMIFTLTDSLWQMGQWEDAESYTVRLYEKCKSVFGSIHPYTAGAAHLAASVYHNRLEKEKAAIWYKKCWDAYRDWPQKEPFEEALYTMKYSRYFRQKGEYPEAESRLKQAEKIYNGEIEAGRDTTRMTSWLMNTLIEHTRICIEQEKYEEALGFCQQAEILSKSLSGGNTTKAYIYHDAAVIWEQMGDTDKSLYYLEKAELYAGTYLAENLPERQCIRKKQMLQKNVVCSVKLKEDV